MKSTQDIQYAQRLTGKDVWWKRLLDVQRPYRKNLQSLGVRNVLEVGCGIGRNLKNLAQLDIDAVGVDHNEHSVAEAKARGFTACTQAEFLREPAFFQKGYDTLLLAHVLEHMTVQESIELIGEYKPYLNNNALIVVITPQESGFASDYTHVEFMDFERVASIISASDLKLENQYSFPFPRQLGKVFKYNEFITTARNG